MWMLNPIISTKHLASRMVNEGIAAVPLEEIKLCPASLPSLLFCFGKTRKIIDPLKADSALDLIIRT